MQKLKNSYIDRMLTARLTRAEVDLILELAHYQDERGRIQGVYYRKVCQAIGFSHETFYVTLQSLAAKELIRFEKTSYGDYDVTLIDNDFLFKEALKEGYISVGADQIFYSDYFRKLKAGEKLLALQIVKIIGANRDNTYDISLENFIEKYKKLLRVERRTIREYLRNLKSIFSVCQKGKMLFFRKQKNKEVSVSDLDNLSAHLAAVAVRRNRIASYSKQQLIDTKLLIK